MLHPLPFLHASNEPTKALDCGGREITQLIRKCFGSYIFLRIDDGNKFLEFAAQGNEQDRKGPRFASTKNPGNT